jgi:hypothetical protein
MPGIKLVRVGGIDAVDFVIASADSYVATALSIVMRRYSECEHLPWAIIRLRRAIVSHDAIINSVNISGSARWRRRMSFAMTVLNVVRIG